jgi:hypothetical protein
MKEETESYHVSNDDIYGITQMYYRLDDDEPQDPIYAKKRLQYLAQLTGNNIDDSQSQESFITEMEKEALYRYVIHCYYTNDYDDLIAMLDRIGELVGDIGADRAKELTIKYFKETIPHDESSLTICTEQYNLKLNGFGIKVTKKRTAKKAS